MHSSAGRFKTLIAVRTVFAACCCALTANGASNDADAWCDLFPAGNRLQSIAFGQGRFVAVGFSGTVVTSEDGINWTRQATPSQDDFYSVAFGNGQFVAVGPACGTASCSGTIMTSPDGFQWVVRPHGSKIWGLNAIAFGKGQFVAVCGGATSFILTSTNGIDWVEHASGLQNNLTAVTFGGGQFVVGSDGGRILTSDDAVQWVERDFGTSADLAGLAFGGGQFAAGTFATPTGASGSTIRTSSDGVQWTERWASLPGQFVQLIGISYGNGIWIAAGYRNGGFLLTSTDGITWTPAALPTSEDFNNNFLASADYGGGQFVAVGDGGLIETSTDAVTWVRRQAGGQMRPVGTSGEAGNYGPPDQSALDTWTPRYKLPASSGPSFLGFVAFGNGTFAAVGNNVSETSTDGVHWDLHSSGPKANGLNALTFGDGKFVGVSAGGTVHTSTDGVNWDSRQSPSGNLYGVGYGNGTFVAVGQGASLLISTDAVTWVSSSAGVNSELDAVAYGNGQFVVVGPNVALTSPDGIKWTHRATDAYTYRVAFGNGHFVAIDLYQSAVTSTDGITWSRTGQNLHAIYFGGGQFVGAENNGGIVTSPDGINWTRHDSGSPDVAAFAYGNGQFVAVGGPGSILSSSNGADWVLRQPGTASSFAAVTFGQGQWVAVGDHGAVLTSRDGFNWIRRASGTQFALQGVAYGHGLFVAVGAGCSGCTLGATTVITSPDGISWSNQVLDTAVALSAITFGDGKFIAVGTANAGSTYSTAVLMSSDGAHWKIRSLDSYSGFGGVAYGRDRFAAVGYDSTLGISSDGNDWALCEPQAPLGFSGITFGNSRFVAVGGRYINPFDYSTSRPQSALVASNPDFTRWSFADPATTNVLRAVAFGDGQFVAVGDRLTLVTSSDGDHWLRHSLRFAPAGFAASGIAYGDGQFMVVSSDGSILGSRRSGPFDGTLGLWLDAGFTNAAPGASIAFTAWHRDDVSRLVWDFGDGTVLSDTSTVRHTWSAPGQYLVRLTAYSDRVPSGETVSRLIEVGESIAYVDAASSHPVAPYRTWDTAAKSIQDAIGAPGGLGRIVLVTNGVYKTGTVNAAGAGPCRVSLTNQVVVRSVNGPAVTIIEGASNGVRCAYVEAGSTLSGFTLTKGFATGEWPSGVGGGLLSDGSGVATNCWLSGNRADSEGGGAHSALLYNCTLTGNFAVNGAGASHCTLRGCELLRNTSGNNGGGADACTLYDCILNGNNAPSDGGWGGGASFSTLQNCLLTANSAGQYGGGALACTLTNCTLVGNAAVEAGGGVYGDANFPGALVNCIVTGNSALAGLNYSGCTFQYCCTTPLVSGVGNIEADPLFVNPQSKDFHLRAASPCIDSGTNLVASMNHDLDGRPRPLDGNADHIAAFDIGAYELDATEFPPEFTLVQRTSSNLALRWNTPAAGMKLQRSSSIVNPTWQDVPGSAGVNTLDLPILERIEFYRLIRP